MSHRIPACLVTVMALTAMAHVAAARTWTNRDGRTVDADFISAQDGKVRIRRTADGKLFDLSLDALSDADRAFVASQRAAKPMPETPLTPKVATAPEGDKGGKADDRQRWIANRVASYELLKAIFEKDIEDTAIDFVSRSGYALEYQFAHCIRMATHVPALPKDEQLVKVKIEAAGAKASLEGAVVAKLLEDEQYVANVLKNNAARMKALGRFAAAAEERYNGTLSEEDAGDLVRYAAQGPKAFVEAHAELRKALVRVLTAKSTMAEAFPTADEESAELIKSRKQVTDLIEAARKKKKD